VPRVFVANPLGIYVSVPFCRAKCTFCNFASDVFGPERMERYVAKLVEEIRGACAAAGKIGAELPGVADTVYFGGGTPSLLSAGQFEEIFSALGSEFEIADGAEVTVECAPGQLEEATLEKLLERGMNRVSFGVQSFVDTEAAGVGRLHTEQECEREIARLRGAGVSEIGLDLIAGLPRQTRESWKYSVERAVATGVPHVSVYMLEVDEESRLGKEVMAGGRRYHAHEVPSEDEAAERYEEACVMLEAVGVQQYEISNFAREGHQSRHNLKYWRRMPYVGFGLDAHSMLEAGDSAVRFANGDELEEYLGRAGVLKVLRERGTDRSSEREVLRLTKEEAFEESMFLGLRLNEGVDMAALTAEFGEPLVGGARTGIEESREAGLVEVEGSRVRLTSRGRMA
jgi:oxygen-independent coproporphyrinogen-3 oxidase